MRAKEAPSAFQVPLAIGRSEGDLVVHGKPQQLDLFREVMTRPVKLQTLSMMALTDGDDPAKAQWAKVADIAEVMGYERAERGKDGKVSFHPELYRRIEEVGIMLRRKAIQLFFRDPAGHRSDGRRKYKVGIVDLNILQEFGFGYLDDEGQEIDLDQKPGKDLIRYESDDGKGPPIWAIPATDANGKQILNKDGTPKRRPASHVIWRWSSKLVEMMKKKGGSWVFFRDALNILKSYLTKPATFDLIWLTLFHKDGRLEIGHDKLVRHLGIRSKDSQQVEKAIKEAFQTALDEGIIDALPTETPRNYYQPTAKTGKPRRVDQVYRWTRAKKWTVSDVKPAALTESMKG